MPDQAQRADRLHRLMGRSVFANADGVVCENINVRQPRKRGQANGWPCVIRKDHEGRAGGTEDAVVGYAIHDRAHAVLTNAKTNVTTGRIVTGKILAPVDVVHSRAVEVGTA